jgi:CCR4-NOT transcription complex subunit 6
MYNQGYQQGQHARMPMTYNYQNQNSRPQQQHIQHQNLQQEHSGYGKNGSMPVHHASYSSGSLSNSTPNFTPHSLYNGYTTTRGGPSQQVNEHWAEQLKLYKESERQRSVMAEQHAPQYHARTMATEHRLPTDMEKNEEAEIRSRPSNMDNGVKRQDWRGMDMSGQGLRILTAPLFNYTFLNELYVASNKISLLPAAIGNLRQLRHLDASGNLLTGLPQELGMCVFLKTLLVFDNGIRTLPSELGSLYQLEMLGIEGNPLEVSMKQEVVERGTKALISRLREEAPGK